jgi:hypothetical protein
MSHCRSSLFYSTLCSTKRFFLLTKQNAWSCLNNCNQRTITVIHLCNCTFFLHVSLKCSFAFGLAHEKFLTFCILVFHSQISYLLCTTVFHSRRRLYSVSLTTFQYFSVCCQAFSTSNIQLNAKCAFSIIK